MWYKMDDPRIDRFTEGIVMTQDGFQVLVVKKENEYFTKYKGWKVQPVRAWM